MRTRAFLASLVPVIVNAVLNEHQLVLDIVAFVALGDFPRSRLGEKQRGKIMGGWVSRKMRTIAQFSIRDPDAESSVGTAVPDNVSMGRRGSGQSGRAGNGSMMRGMGTAGSSLRQVESITHLPNSVAEEPSHYPSQEARQEHLHTLSLQTPSTYQANVQNQLLAGGYRGSHSHFDDRDRDGRSDNTPTNETPRPLHLNTTLEYSPVDAPTFDSPEMMRHATPSGEHSQPHYQHQQQAYHQSYGEQGGSEYASYEPSSPIDVDLGTASGWHGNTGGGGGGGGLRVANRSSGVSDDWPQEALRHMSLGEQQRN